MFDLPWNPKRAATERYARLDERPPLGEDTQRMLAEPWKLAAIDWSSGWNGSKAMKTDRRGVSILEQKYRITDHFTLLDINSRLAERDICHHPDNSPSMQRVWTVAFISFFPFCFSFCRCALQEEYGLFDGWNVEGLITDHDEKQISADHFQLLVDESSGLFSHVMDDMSR